MISDPSAQGIAASVAHLLQSGAIPPMTRLPTVRALALALYVGPSTVADAWRQLAAQGLIVSHGRRGTHVAARILRADRRMDAMRAFNSPLDLSLALPDRSLLPDLRRVLGPCLALLDDFNRYDSDRLLPSLEVTLREQWPFDAEAFITTNGGHAALFLIAQSLFHRGDRVAVENPTGSAILDILDSFGLDPVPVDCDDEGILPASLGKAVHRGVRGVLLQPRMANPHGHVLSPARARRLAHLVSRSDCVVIEDDSAPALSCRPAFSVGSMLPGRTLLVRSWNKSHGPDLKMAAVGGPAAAIEIFRARQRIASWGTSRIMQAALAYMLRERRTCAVLERARRSYRCRRLRLVEALARHGTGTSGIEGLAVWVEVADEIAVHRALARRGIGVSLGDPFLVAPLGRQHIRISATVAHERHDEIARTIAHANRGHCLPC